MKLAIDNEKLGGAIDRQDTRMTLHADAIHTRAQVRLEAEMTRKVELQNQISEEDGQLTDLRSQRDRLNALIAKGEGTVKDARTELKAVLQSIHSMEQDGVHL